MVSRKLLGISIQEPIEDRRTIPFRCLVITLIVGVLVIAIALAVGLGVGLSKKDDGSSFKFKSAHDRYHHAAVTSDHKICSDIGRDLMKRHKGNAVDAAIATLLCIGAMCTQSGGIGGGSLAVVYKKSDGWKAYDFRETAPAAATENMFENKSSETGGLAIGVPGEIHGANEMHTKYGTLPWTSIVMPTVKLLRDGFHLPTATYGALSKKIIKKDGFKMFVGDDNKKKPIGSLIKMPKLAQTFQRIADDPQSFYRGSLAQDIVDDLAEAGSNITLEDLKDYKTRVRKPIKLELPNDKTLYSIPPPGSGPVLAFILSILSGYGMNADSIANTNNTVLTDHRIVEAMKFAYAKRSALGDEDFVDVTTLVSKMTSRIYGEEIRHLINDMKTQNVTYYKPSFENVEDHGTTHLNVLDAEGNAVSITSTINLYFGSKIVGNRTGIIFNNGMDDFSTPNVTNHFGIPPSPANFIKPGKRSMSSMCPTIVWDNQKDRVCLVTGSAGGSRITTATALAVMDTLWFNMSVVASMDRPRFHHQLIPNNISAEADFPQEVKVGLEKKGHTFETSKKTVVGTIGRLRDEIEAAADYRKGGAPSGF